MVMEHGRQLKLVLKIEPFQKTGNQFFRRLSNNVLSSGCTILPGEGKVMQVATSSIL